MKSLGKPCVNECSSIIMTGFISVVRHRGPLAIPSIPLETCSLGSETRWSRSHCLRMASKQPRSVAGETQRERATAGLCVLSTDAEYLWHPSLPPGPNQIPSTYYALPQQDQYVTNLQRISSTPYAQYFHPTLFVNQDMTGPEKQPIDCPSQALKNDFSDVNTLIVPASTQLPNENAWCAYPSGQGYVSSRTSFPGVTADMITWWFWWHSKEGARYSLWNPYAHQEAASSFADKFDDPKLNNTQKLIGSVHHITEIIGDQSLTIDIHWKQPSYFKLDESKFAAAGIVASACGEIFFGTSGSPLKAVDMIHLWYKTDSGLELRSRYFLASSIRIDVPVLGKLIPLDTLANLFGIKQFIVGRKLSHDQYIHDQQEMTHLAAILPDVYKAFGNGAK